MILGLLLAAAPLFSDDLLWDQTVPPAAYFEIERETVSTGAKVIVGSTLGLHEYEYDPVTRAITVVKPLLHWRLIWDKPSDWGGVDYRYRVRACHPEWVPVCGAWSVVVKGK